MDPRARGTGRSAMASSVTMPEWGTASVPVSPRNRMLPPWRRQPARIEAGGGPVRIWSRATLIALSVLVLSSHVLTFAARPAVARLVRWSGRTRPLARPAHSRERVSVLPPVPTIRGSAPINAQPTAHTPEIDRLTDTTVTERPQAPSINRSGSRRTAGPTVWKTWSRVGVERVILGGGRQSCRLSATSVVARCYGAIRGHRGDGPGDGASWGAVGAGSRGSVREGARGVRGSRG
jgi:hypothetical protein